MKLRTLLLTAFVCVAWSSAPGQAAPLELHFTGVFDDAHAIGAGAGIPSVEQMSHGMPFSGALFLHTGGRDRMPGSEHSRRRNFARRFHLTTPAFDPWERPGFSELVVSNNLDIDYVIFFVATETLNLLMVLGDEDGTLLPDDQFPAAMTFEDFERLDFFLSDGPDVRGGSLASLSIVPVAAVPEGGAIPTVALVGVLLHHRQRQHRRRLAL